MFAIKNTQLYQPSQFATSIMTVVLRAARLLVDSSSELIEDGLVIINDGRITKADSFRNLKGTVAISQEVRDLGDVTLMPGLFDCHVSFPLSPF
jgi:imidazolonepropionase-like amidohydrolase